MTERDRRQLTTWLVIAAFSALAGAIFGVFQADYSWIGAPRGALTGLLIGGSIAAFEISANAGTAGVRLRAIPISALFGLRTVVYVSIIVAGEMLARLAFSGTIPSQPFVFDQQLVNTLAFSIPGALLVNLIFIMIQTLGAGTLLNLVSGRYHRPREEERIFMFVDMADSTGIAERIGNRRFHALLGRFFADLAVPVVENGGSIHRYVGDEMIVTWRMRDPVRNARPLLAYVQMRAAIAAARPDYEQAFGVAPRFRVALHAGRVVTGEMGSWKREITFLGDVVNTTGRIEQLCRDTGCDALASRDLIDRLTPPESGPTLLPMGPFPLRGRHAEIELFAVEGGTAWN